MMAKKIQPETPIPIDLTDLARPRARKIKYLKQVRGGYCCVVGVWSTGCSLKPAGSTRRPNSFIIACWTGYTIYRVSTRMLSARSSRRQPKMGNRVLWSTIDLFGGRCRGHRRAAVANSESARQAAGYVWGPGYQDSRPAGGGVITTKKRRRGRCGLGALSAVGFRINRKCGWPRSPLPADPARRYSSWP